MANQFIIVGADGITCEHTPINTIVGSVAENPIIIDDAGNDGSDKGAVGGDAGNDGSDKGARDAKGINYDSEHSSDDTETSSIDSNIATVDATVDNDNSDNIATEPIMSDVYKEFLTQHRELSNNNRLDIWHSPTIRVPPSEFTNIRESVNGWGDSDNSDNGGNDSTGDVYNTHGGYGGIYGNEYGNDSDDPYGLGGDNNTDEPRIDNDIKEDIKEDIDTIKEHVENIDSVIIEMYDEFQENNITVRKIASIVSATKRNIEKNNISADSIVRIENELSCVNGKLDKLTLAVSALSDAFARSSPRSPLLTTPALSLRETHGEWFGRDPTHVSPPSLERVTRPSPYSFPNTNPSGNPFY